jgi:hypothetical protein
MKSIATAQDGKLLYIVFKNLQDSAHISNWEIGSFLLQIESKRQIKKYYF